VRPSAHTMTCESAIPLEHSSPVNFVSLLGNPIVKCLSEPSATSGVSGLALKNVGHPICVLRFQGISIAQRSNSSGPNALFGNSMKRTPE
jgi:hypothetical protein